MPSDSEPAAFQNLLLRRVDPADLAHYAAADLCRIAEDAHRHLSAPHHAGHPHIVLADHEVRFDGRSREITVLDVVNDNMPFLLDSTLAELVEQGLEPVLLAHPILAVERDAAGVLRRLAGEATGATQPGTRRESLLHIHLDRIDDTAVRAALTEGLARVYADVAVAVTDWVAMRTRVYEAMQAFRVNPPPLPNDEVGEAIAFLDWIGADNFTFLGVREYRLPDGDAAADPVAESGLGLLRDPDVRVLRRGRDLVVMTPEIRAFLERPQALIIAKANVKSRVHRRVHLDYIGIKLFSRDGRLEGELRVIGLFAANLYTNVTSAIPYLRRKVARVVAQAGFDPASYAGRSLLAVLESYPRDELFQLDDAMLYRFAIAIMNLSERPRIRALARADEFDRFISALVFVPKDRYDSEVRRRIGTFLAQLYQGRVSAAYPSYPEGPLARTHFIIGHDEGRTPQPDQATLERGIAAIVRTWNDALRDSLEADVGGARARALYARYAEAFSAAYREAFPADAATRDIALLERLSEDQPRAVDLYRRERDPDTRVNLRLFSRGTALPLSQRVPLLENLGFRVVNERTYRITAAADPVWLHDMTLERASGAAIDIAATHAPVEETLLALLGGRADSDGFNRLVLEAGLPWRDVAMIRALARYLRQIQVPYAQDYLAATLTRHAGITSAIVALFHLRFDPAATDSTGPGRAAGQARIRGEIETMLAGVESLDDDRILRRFVNLIEAAVRSNFYQRGPDGAPRPTITVKFLCAGIEALPLPRPMFEIFVYCPRVEGLHLRFGKAARGGLRWSDRPQDYRTEVLGLVKAQQVKNAVIVPAGAKGGFVPSYLPPPSDRVAWMAEGTESYRIFVRSLLELTDNIVHDAVVPPAGTVRHDPDDPYLVVAADKGTATFSDVANALSIEMGFWLGDAFASGGSNGYDHKHMAITARGAWEAVKRHFRELDIDIQQHPVTMAGVGDMSGDVFGNGALQSRAMKLIAAFDHRDVFLDPDPDPETSWGERKRLFDLPRSSWADYDRAKISTGGGVFPRSAKSIPLSPQVRAAIGFDRAEAPPAEVINAILKAPVGLLFFGGIGTYVRATSETDAEVGDRANDAVRITGAELRAKVVGEGANLGVTQRGRIEAARAGVQLNSDAIDNSAGVNTSDVEVNIKIALSLPERDGRLDQQSRSALLAEMTDEVAALVLRNNYLQPLAISLAERRAAAELGFARRLMLGLEQAGKLDRTVECLPDEIALTERARRGEGLARPEIAVLLAYAKIALDSQLLDSPIPDDPYLGRELDRYFPAQLRARFPDAIAAHKLRREIIATQVANAIVNRAGPTAVTRLEDETGADAPTIAASYAATRDCFGLVDLNGAVDALDGVVPGRLQLDLYAALQDLLMHRMVWFIRNVDLMGGTLDAVVERFRGGIAAVERRLDALLPADAVQALHARATELTDHGIPATLATRIAGLQELAEVPDIVLVSERTAQPVPEVAATHFAIAGLFRLGTITRAAEDVVVNDYYDRLALDRAVDAIGVGHRRLTAQVARSGRLGAEGAAAWIADRGAEVARIRNGVDGIVTSGLTLSKLMVAASLLGDLARE